MTDFLVEELPQPFLVQSHDPKSWTPKLNGGGTLDAFSSSKVSLPFAPAFTCFDSWTGKTRKEMKENISQLLLASEYMALVSFFLTGFGMASVFVCKFYESAERNKSIY